MTLLVASMRQKLQHHLVIYFRQSLSKDDLNLEGVESLHFIMESMLKLSLRCLSCYCYYFSLDDLTTTLFLNKFYLLIDYLLIGY